MIKVCVPEGVEVEIVRDKWMPKGMVVLSREDAQWNGWWIIRREESLFMPVGEVHELYREALTLSDFLRYGDKSA